MADILGVAVHAVGRAKAPTGAPVLCIGGGPVGLSIAQVARVRGAGKVFVAETSPIAQQVLSQFDIIVVDPKSIRDGLAAHIGRAEVAVIYDSVGTEETFSEAISLLDVCGVYVNLAVHSASLSFNATQLGSERSVTTSSNAFYDDVREAYDLIYSRKVRTGPMVTHCLPLAEYRQAFDLLLSTPKQAYKVVFAPSSRRAS